MKRGPHGGGVGSELVRGPLGEHEMLLVEEACGAVGLDGGGVASDVGCVVRRIAGGDVGRTAGLRIDVAVGGYRVGRRENRAGHESDVSCVDRCVGR